MIRIIREILIMLNVLEKAGNSRLEVQSIHDGIKNTILCNGKVKFRIYLWIQ